jgi:hypothetical protein
LKFVIKGWVSQEDWPPTCRLRSTKFIANNRIYRVGQIFLVL